MGLDSNYVSLTLEQGFILRTCDIGQSLLLLWGASRCWQNALACNNQKCHLWIISPPMENQFSVGFIIPATAHFKRIFRGTLVAQRLNNLRHTFEPQIGKILQRRKWQSAPVFLPGKFHGKRSLLHCSSWGHKESNSTERQRTHMHPFTLIGSSRKKNLKICDS